MGISKQAQLREIDTRDRYQKLKEEFEEAQEQFEDACYEVIERVNKLFEDDDYGPTATWAAISNIVNEAGYPEWNTEEEHITHALLEEKAAYADTYQEQHSDLMRMLERKWGPRKSVHMYLAIKPEVFSKIQSELIPYLEDSELVPYVTAEGFQSFVGDSSDDAQRDGWEYWAWEDISLWDDLRANWLLEQIKKVAGDPDCPHYYDLRFLMIDSRGASSSPLTMYGTYDSVFDLRFNVSVLKDGDRVGSVTLL